MVTFGKHQKRFYFFDDHLKNTWLQNLRETFYLKRLECCKDVLVQYSVTLARCRNAVSK